MRSTARLVLRPPSFRGLIEKGERAGNDGRDARCPHRALRPAGARASGAHQRAGAAPYKELFGRGAIHALAPGDLALYGRALIARDDGELAQQLGRQVQRLAADKGFAPGEALEEVATVTRMRWQTAGRSTGTSCTRNCDSASAPT
jgi:hypothetical protein